MADGKDETESKMDRAARKVRAAERAQKRKVREAARREKAAESGKAAVLCSLATVSVKKGKEGFHMTILASDGRKSFNLTTDDAKQVMRDLAMAIKVIHSQQ